MITYPRLLRRIQAVLIDSVIIPVILVSVLLLIGQLNLENVYMKAAALILPVFILEPGLVSLTGGTIGHHILKIKIQRSKTKKNLNIFLAILRFIVKTLLGWLSFVFVLTTKRHQAIHDVVSGSIVINKSSEGLSNREALNERIPEEESGYQYPSIFLRFGIIILYNILLFILVSILIVLSLSPNCLEHDICNNTDNILSTTVDVFWIIGVIITIISGWKGRLYGCRRKILT